MKTHGKHWLVVATYSKVNTTAHDPGFKICCVRAKTEPHANKEGYDLLGLEITQVIPMDKIKPGWIFGEGD